MNRVEFYLGKLSFKNVDKLQVLTYEDLKDNLVELPLKKLLKKNNVSHLRFHAFFKDIADIKHAACLVKVRLNDHSVLLRSINVDRHWGHYYHKPPDTPFEKKINTVYWRGATTGSPHKLANRFTLVKKWFHHPNMDIGFSEICQGKDNYSQFVKGKDKIKDFLKYKYILSVEGNDKDSGIQWKLNSNSLVMMAKPRCTSWLMETTLIPNYHYLLLKDDFSDLEEKILLCNKHPNECKKIIRNANKFMSQFANEELEQRIENTVIQEYFKRANGVFDKHKLYTAVIIEPRIHKALPFVIDNALHGLNKDWTILILCSNTNIHKVTPLLGERVKCHIIFDKNITKEQYSEFCASEEFHQLIPTETFLLFQTDSMILNPSRVGKFLKYDYVGAPWKDGVGNGGFSLRKKSKMLEIIRTVPYLGEAEDLYFCKQTTVPLYRPSIEEAKEFSVEHYFQQTPFGTHQPWVCQDYSKLAELYPLIKVLKHKNDISI